MGLTREAAARFSFLLSVPIILLSGALVTRDLLASPVAVNWTDLLLGTGIAAISAFLCIHYFLILLQRVGMLPFVVYRLVLGVVLLVLFV
jgi:undecaprenyl-diphosphatase